MGGIAYVAKSSLGVRVFARYHSMCLQGKQVVKWYAIREVLMKARQLGSGSSVILIGDKEIESMCNREGRKWKIGTLVYDIRRLQSRGIKLFF